MMNRDPDKKIDPDNKMPEHIKRDPDRDMSDVPGSYNPGNQAGKGGDPEKNDPAGRSIPDKSPSPKRTDKG